MVRDLGYAVELVGSTNLFAASDNLAGEKDNTPWIVIIAIAAIIILALVTWLLIMKWSLCKRPKKAPPPLRAVGARRPRVASQAQERGGSGGGRGGGGDGGGNNAEDTPRNASKKSSREASAATEAEAAAAPSALGNPSPNGADTAQVHDAESVYSRTMRANHLEDDDFSVLASPSVLPDGDDSDVGALLGGKGSGGGGAGGSDGGQEREDGAAAVVAAAQLRLGDLSPDGADMARLRSNVAKLLAGDHETASVASDPTDKVQLGQSYFL